MREAPEKYSKKSVLSSVPPFLPLLLVLTALLHCLHCPHHQHHHRCSRFCSDQAPKRIHQDQNPTMWHDEPDENTMWYVKKLAYNTRRLEPDEHYMGGGPYHREVDEHRCSAQNDANQNRYCAKREEAKLRSLPTCSGWSRVHKYLADNIPQLAPEEHQNFVGDCDRDVGETMIFCQM